MWRGTLFKADRHCVSCDMLHVLQAVRHMLYTMYTGTMVQ